MRRKKTFDLSNPDTFTEETYSGKIRKMVDSVPNLNEATYSGIRVKDMPSNFVRNSKRILSKTVIENPYEFAGLAAGLGLAGAGYAGYKTYKYLKSEATTEQSPVEQSSEQVEEIATPQVEEIVIVQDRIPVDIDYMKWKKEHLLIPLAMIVMFIVIKSK